MKKIFTCNLHKTVIFSRECYRYDSCNNIIHPCRTLQDFFYWNTPHIDVPDKHLL